jgi:OmpA-OmpF porin, OOP family
LPFTGAYYRLTNYMKGSDMRKILVGAVISAAAVLPSLASAESGKWYLNGGVGYQVFDQVNGGADLDNMGVLVLGAEKQLSDKWGVGFWLDYGEADGKYISTLDVDYASANLDLVRYFGSGGKFEPYTALGIGHVAQSLEDDALDPDFESTQLNAGAGFRYLFTEALSLRADARYLYDTDDELNHGLVTLGLSYAFGGKAAPAPVVAPEPIVNDMDADGVEDDVDQCSGTPAGIAVDAKGCPLDGDSDGVPNYRDKCPNTPAGRQVDKFGCKFVLTSTESIKLEIGFASNSDVIPTVYKGELEKVAVFLKKFTGVSAVIEGHSDSMGAAVYNKSLSQRRADAVRKALIDDYGIAANRLRAVGFGEERPVASNDTAQGRKANRRVVAVMEAEVTR